MNKYKNIDLHMHSTYSDGTDTPATLVENANIIGLDLMSLTDHDTIKGCQNLLALPNHPDFVTGIEFSCKSNGQKCHLLGYGFDINDSGIKAITDATYKARVDKVACTFDYLKDNFNIVIPEADMNEALSSNSPSHSHVAQLMIKNGFASDTVEAFRIIDGYQGKGSYVTPEEAIEVILGAGGVPVLAHGVFEDGGGNLDFNEMQSRVRKLKDAGLMGLECYYSTFEQKHHDIMLALATEFNLLVTAGSDYHGTNKTVPFAHTGKFPVKPEIMEPFYDVITDKVISAV